MFCSSCKKFSASLPIKEEKTLLKLIKREKTVLNRTVKSFPLKLFN